MTLGAASVEPASRELSIVIKAFNEELNIEHTLRSAMAAAAGLDAEIIVADSLSNDTTVEIAKRFPVTVVQLVNGADRCCGAGAQLGYQYARGRYVLVMDGDMLLERDWLHAAMQRLQRRPQLAGLGGTVDDMNLDNIEFRARKQRKPKDRLPGPVDYLGGGGLYRRSAIQQVGYLTHRSLHACEELELGLRLTHAGWQLERMDQVSIRHYGHTLPMWTLIKRRWRTRYTDGGGELLRSSLGHPWFWRTVVALRLSLGVLAWMTTILALAVFGLFGHRELLQAFIFVGLMPVILMIVRKRSVSIGLYSIMSWCIDAAGMLRGLFAVQSDPHRRVASRIFHGA
jgi:glycosyltransferase involved in cell wall biosynthesis